MGISLVVFDIAGTTVKDKNNVGLAFQRALLKFGFDVPLDDINPLMGYEKHEAIQAILEKLPQDREYSFELIEQIHKEFVELMIQFYTETDDLFPLPNVEATFAILKGMGLKIALNTGFSEDITKIIVSRLGWLERSLVDYTISSDEVENGRPNPAMIHQLMERSGIQDSQEVMKVGDTEVDVNEGLNAKCQFVVAVTTGAYTRDELAKHHPTHILDDIAEIVPIIKKANA